MNDQKNKLKIDRDFDNLAPFFAQKLRFAIAECQAEGYPVELFEGMRSGDRQAALYSQGRTAPGKIVTYARPGESWHAYGLACDLVGFVNGRWDWSIDYDRVEQIMISHGFGSLKFERAHFQITGGMSIQKAQKIAAERGLLALWSIVESSLHVAGK
jgi:peptidoglycan L-alanyl-D-glutamate endopeptidase CwlK